PPTAPSDGPRRPGAATTANPPATPSRSVLKKVSSWGSAWPGFRFRRSPAAGPFALRSSPHSLPCRTRGQRRAGSAVRTTPGGPAAWSGGQHPGAVAAGQALPEQVAAVQRGGAALEPGVVPGRPAVAELEPASPPGGDLGDGAFHVGPVCRAVLAPPPAGAPVRTGGAQQV